MATLTIRGLEDTLKERLRVRAAQHRRSMEEEVREILRASLSARNKTSSDLGRTIRSRFASLGGVELKIPARDPVRRSPFEDE